MTPPARFSWTGTLRALGRPGPPPPGLVRVGTLLLGFCLAAVLVLVSLGYVWHDNPHRYFGERKAGTYLSFLNLLATGAVSASIVRRLGPTYFARFWWAAAVGFVWLGCDDLFTLHEQIDRSVHALLGLDPEDPVTDHLDDLIVASYGVAALVRAYRHRADLQSPTWMHRLLGGAFNGSRPRRSPCAMVLNWFGLASDVDDSRRMLLELRETRDKLTRAARFATGTELSACAAFPRLVKPGPLVSARWPAQQLHTGAV